MDTRKVTLVATIAVIALVAVGIGFAYTAATTNSGNDVTPGYMETTLRASSNNTTPAYTDSFDGNVKYNTVTTYETSQEYITFTFDNNQLNTDTDGDSTNDAVKVGLGVYLNIAYIGGVTEAFKVVMSADSGVTSTLYTYVIGYKYGTSTESLSAERFVPFEPAVGALLDANGSAFTGGDASGIKVILINLYVKGMTGEQKYLKSEAEESLIKPLKNVTFKFNAISETTITAEKYTVTYPASPANGTVAVAPAATAIVLGTSTTITITPAANYRIATLTLNGIDYMPRVADATAASVITLSINQNVAVAVTFASNA